MLEIIKFNENEYEFPCLIVLGCFDAVHSGHAELLKKAKLQAKINGLDLGVMLFAEGKGGKQILTFDEKLALLEQYNVKFVLKVDFNDELKKIKPLDFLQLIEDKINVKAYMSGKDFRFGNGAKGKSSTLKNYAEDEENGVWYMPVKDVTYGADKISTTLIKKLLEEGQIKLADELLGRNFSVTGTVVAGADRGGKVLGFPTLNIEYPAEKADIKQGVYAVKCNVGEEEFLGIANYGARPTFEEETPLLEVYLKDFSGDLYGSSVTVEFTDYIRDIEKFSGGEELKTQLEHDLLFLDNCAEESESALAVEELAVADATEDTVETSVEETAEPQVEEISEPIAKESGDFVNGEVVEENAAEAVSEDNEEPVEEAFGEKAEEFAEDVTEEMTDEPVKEINEEVTEEFVENVNEEAGEEVIEDAADADGFYEDYDGDEEEEFANLTETEIAEEVVEEQPVADDVAAEPEDNAVEETESDEQGESGD